MIISDLNHLEIVSEDTKVVGGTGGNFFDLDFDKEVDIDFTSTVDIDKDIDSNADVSGVVLTAEASFTIEGYDDALGEAEAGVFASPGFYAGFAQASIGLS